MEESLVCDVDTCSTAVTYNLNELTNRDVNIKLLRGKLYIECNKIYMTGPAVTVFEGKLNIERNDKNGKYK